jgi:uroporphyrin-III C-methyltransferase/precorrin-2 dehydrogenase/sirohydrochlorin ferrochelatase
VSVLIPLFVDLGGQRVVVTGGGRAAFESVRRLVAAEARVELHAPDAAAAREALAGCDCEIVEGPSPSADCLDGARLLVAASEDETADAALLEAAALTAMPAVSLTGGSARAHLGRSISRGGVSVAATTSSLCPELEQRLVNDARRSLVDEIDSLAEVLGDIRAKLEERFPQDDLRASIWEQIFDAPILALLQAGDEDEAHELAERMAWGTG